VNDVDDIAGSPFGQLLGKSLGEEDWRPQIDIEMRLPALPVEACDRIPIEARGVVDEAPWRTEPLAAGRDEGCQQLDPREIGLKRGCAAARALDLRPNGQSLSPGGVKMAPPPPAVARKIQSNCAAKPFGRAGHQYGPGFFVSGHGWLREGAANRFRRGEFALRGHSRRASRAEQGLVRPPGGAVEGSKHNQ